MEGNIVNHRSLDCLHSQVVCQLLRPKDLFPLHKVVEPFFLQQIIWFNYGGFFVPIFECAVENI